MKKWISDPNDRKKQEDKTLFGKSANFSPGLYNITKDVYAWMQPNGSWGESNAGLIISEKQALLVDTLWDIKLTSSMLKEMQAVLSGRNITHLINTHSDGDHWWGNQLLSGSTIISSENTKKAMLHPPPKIVNLLSNVGKVLKDFDTLPIINKTTIPVFGKYIDSMFSAFDFKNIKATYPNNVFQTRKTLLLDDIEIILIEVGPAHTPGDVVVHIPEKRVLFAGDIIFYGSTPISWVGPISKWIAALNWIDSLDIDYIVPGHGPIIEKKELESLKTYFEIISIEAKNRFDANIPYQMAAKDILINIISKKEFILWDAPERILVNIHTLYSEFKHKKVHTNPIHSMKLLYEMSILEKDLRQYL